MPRPGGFQHEKRCQDELDYLVGVPDKVPRPDQNPEEDRQCRVSDEDPPGEAPVVRDPWYRQSQGREEHKIPQPVEDKEREALEAEIEEDHPDPERAIRGDARRSHALTPTSWPFGAPRLSVPEADPPPRRSGRGGPGSRR